MTSSKGNLKVCSKGHKYYKSSDCPTCPVCEEEKKPKNGFLSMLASPARRALEREGIVTLKQLSRYTEEELLQIHGFGKASLPKLKAALEQEGLTFKE